MFLIEYKQIFTLKNIFSNYINNYQNFIKLNQWAASFFFDAKIQHPLFHGYIKVLKVLWTNIRWIPFYIFFKQNKIMIYKSNILDVCLFNISFTNAPNFHQWFHPFLNMSGIFSITDGMFMSDLVLQFKPMHLDYTVYFTKIHAYKNDNF